MVMWIAQRRQENRLSFVATNDIHLARGDGSETRHRGCNAHWLASNGMATWACARRA